MSEKLIRNQDDFQGCNEGYWRVKRTKSFTCYLCVVINLYQISLHRQTQTRVVIQWYCTNWLCFGGADRLVISFQVPRQLLKHRKKQVDPEIDVSLNLPRKCIPCSYCAVGSYEVRNFFSSRVDTFTGSFFHDFSLVIPHYGSHRCLA